MDDLKEELGWVLNHLGLDPYGPEGKTDKATIVYQVTWIVEYDPDTKKCIQAKRVDHIL